MDFLHPAHVQQLDHALGLQRDVVAAARLEAGFAMAGDVRDDHPVAADKVPGETQPEVLVGTETMEHQHTAGGLVRPALPGRDGHFGDGHDDLVQPVQLGLGRHAQVIEPVADGRVGQPAPGNEHCENDEQQKHHASPFYLLRTKCDRRVSALGSSDES
ncbi:hypothetical protein D3C84_738210 [compost metagenome]